MLNKIVIPVLVFFDEKKQIDIEINKKYIDLLNKSRFKQIILLGTTSEGVLISLKEKEKLIKLYEKYLDKNINIILTPSLWAIEDFRNLAILSDRIKDILFLPNSYFNRKENDMLTYMLKIFKGINKNIYLYNLPKNTLVNFTPDIIVKLKAELNIKGIKLSHLSNDYIINYKNIDNFEILYGSDKDIFKSLKLGADKVVAQNLSAALHLDINEQNIQKIANTIRSHVSNHNNKIQALKSCLPNFNNIVL